MAKAKDLETAVKLARLYIGCIGKVRLPHEQKLYNRMRRSVAAVAKKRGISETDAYEQITDEAKRRGGICPLPGKDF